MSISKNLVSNTIFLFLDWFLVFILSFFFWIFIWKNLSPLQSGIFSAAQNLIIIIASLTTFGFSTACAKLIPEYIETKKFGLSNSLIVFSFKILLITSLLAAVLLILVSAQITSFIQDFPNNAVIMVAIGAVFLTFASITSSILSGFQNMKKIFVTDTIATTVKFIVALALIILGFQYIGPLAGLVIGFAVLALLRLNLNWFKKTSMNINKKFVVNDYAFPAFIASIGPIILSNFPYIILSLFSGLAANGIFTAAISITSQLTVMISILSSAIFPVVSQLSVYKNMKSKQNQIINLGIKYGLFISLPIALVLILAPRTIILLLSQSKYLPSADLLPILSLSFMITGVGSIFASSLYAVRKPKINRNIWLFSSLLFLTISIPATIYYSAYGISVAYLISSIVLFSLSLFYLQKYMKFRIEWKTILKLFVASLVFVLFILSADYLSFSVFNKFLVGGIGLITYFALLLPLKFFNDYDVRLLRILSEKIPIFKKIFSSIIRIVSYYS